MDVNLCVDVQRHILTVYCVISAPLTRRACTRWRTIVASVPLADDRFSPYRLACLGESSVLEPVFTMKCRKSLKEDCLEGAARHGHENIVRRCLQWGAGNVNAALKQAARGGHERLVRLFKDEFGATEPQRAISAAASKGHLPLLNLCRNEWGLGDRFEWLSAAMSAAREGRIHVLRLFHKWNPPVDTDIVPHIIMFAAMGGQMELVRLCHDEWGATSSDIDICMRFAAESGFEDIVRVCHDEWGSMNVNGAMIAAARGGHEHIMRLCKEQWGAAQFDYWLMASAQQSKKPHIMALCRQWCDENAHVQNE